MPSLWEQDRRPNIGCVVCFEAPDRVIDLPDLRDVHTSFASSSLCQTCADLAVVADADGLRDRGLRGWAAEGTDPVPDLVRLVMAWAGHHLPLAPKPHDHAPVVPLTASDQEIWRALEPLMAQGPNPWVSVRGRITSSRPNEETIVTDAVLDGPRMRLTTLAGQVRLVSDGVTTWELWGQEMLVSAYRPDPWLGDGADLAGRRAHQDPGEYEFGTPVGPIESVQCLGRPAWRFRFAAPARKPYDMRVIIDAQTGLFLERRFGEDIVATWTEFDVGTPVTDEMFAWDGSVVTAAELIARREADEAQDMADRDAWFRANVTTDKLEINGSTVHVQLNDWHEDGSFAASWGQGSFARRPRCGDWWDLSWQKVTDRWSDQNWDWALNDQGYPAADTEGTAAVRHWLQHR